MMPKCRRAWVLGLVVLAAACAAPRKAMYLHPQMKDTPPAELLLLPIVDRRPDRSMEIDLEADLRLVVRKELEEKGYRVRLAQGFPGGTSETFGDLGEEELAALVPNDAEAIFVVYLEELFSEKSTRFLIPKYVFIEELSGRLVAREGFLWEDTSKLEGMGGGLIGAAISSASFESHGRESGARKLMESLPKCKRGS